MPSLTPHTKNLIKKIVIGAMAGYVFFNPNSWRLVKLMLEEHKIKREIASLEKENESILKEIKRLETDPEYYGYVVRRELGMIKQGEIEFRFSK